MPKSECGRGGTGSIQTIFGWHNKNKTEKAFSHVGCASQQTDQELPQHEGPYHLKLKNKPTNLLYHGEWRSRYHC